MRDNSGEHMSNTPIHPGAIAWTGENPGIYLKDTQDGPWTGLATFFRITWSPFGMGSGVLLLDQPNDEQSLPDAVNICISDNEEMARYLVADFFSNFASFRVSPGLKAIQYLPLTEAYREGDTRSTYSEIVKSADFDVKMTWRELGAPYAVDMPPDKGPTGRHEMYSLFLDAADASVTVNGNALKGKVVERDFADTKKSTAFLAFSESWMET
jgi:hypothetical protein